MRCTLPMFRAWRTCGRPFRPKVQEHWLEQGAWPLGICGHLWALFVSKSGWKQSLPLLPFRSIWFVSLFRSMVWTFWIWVDWGWPRIMTIQGVQRHIATFGIHLSRQRCRRIRWKWRKARKSLSPQGPFRVSGFWDFLRSGAYILILVIIMPIVGDAVFSCFLRVLVKIQDDDFN